MTPPLVHRRFTLGPFETNAYVVHDPETREAAILDVGFDAAVVRAAVEKERLQVRWLLATHAHYDHVADMAALEDAYDLPVHLHAEDRPLIEALGGQAAAFGLPAVRAPRSLALLADGQILALGRGALEVIHTPGHSPGSVTFRSGDALWSGDLLFAGSIGRTDFPGGDFAVLARSVRERLFPLGDDLKVYPGHGPETTLGVERLTNPFVGDGAVA